jgi:hypothetical protein
VTKVKWHYQGSLEHAISVVRWGIPRQTVPTRRLALAKDAHLRPANWKSGKSTGNIAAAVVTATKNEGKFFLIGIAISRCGVTATKNEGKFILIGIAIKDWRKLLMPDSLKEHKDIKRGDRTEKASWITVTKRISRMALTHTGSHLTGSSTSTLLVRWTNL